MSRDQRAALLEAAQRELSRVPAALETLLGGLEPAVGRTRPAPDEWAPVEILCHLRDEEAEDFGARLRALLRGDSDFAPIDPVGWVEARRYRDADLREALDEFRARREQTMALLAGLAAERLDASITHPVGGRLSGLDIVAAWVAHDRLHLAQLAATLARLWANRWPELRVEYAGPIPYPSGEASGAGT